MIDEHPYLDLLLAAHRGEVPWREVDRLRRRLLREECAGCESWSEVFAGFLRDRGRSGRAGRAGCYAAVAAGLADLEEAFAGDLPEVERDLRTLRRLPPERLERRVARSFTRFRSPLLVTALLREARGWLRRDPRRTLAWLAAARAATQRLTVEIEHPDHFVALRDLRLRIRAQEANTFRVLGDLPEADAAFSELNERLAAGEPPGIAVSAELASLEASLRLDQRRLTEALALLDRAALAFHRVADRVGAAKVTMKRGIAWCILGRIEEAVPCFEQAIEATNSAEDLELAISPRHSLLLCLCDLDRPEEARALLERFRPLYRRLDLPVAPIWLAWAEGKVAAAAGDDEAATEQLGRARAGYSGLQLGFDAALVSLDLGQVHLRRGETAEVKRLAEEMAHAFADRGVDPEALRAVQLFQQAALAEAVTAEILLRTRAALMLAPRPVAVAS